MPDSLPISRWLCKKVARKSVALGSWVTGALDRTDTSSVRVLTYHRFGNNNRSPFCIPTDEFEHQVRFLAEHDLAISQHHFEEYIAGDRGFSGTKVLLTIDDGFESTYAQALPVLERHQVPSVAFLSPGLIDAQSVADAPEPYMSWKQVSDTANTMMRIGSHSMLHKSYGAMTDSQTRHDARDSKDRLEEHLPYDVTSFAYPFGTKADFTDDAARIIGQCGYKLAFTSQHGSTDSNDNAFSLPRVKVESGESMFYFKLLTRGSMDAWRYIDRHLWRLQARQ